MTSPNFGPALQPPMRPERRVLNLPARTDAVPILGANGVSDQLQLSPSDTLQSNINGALGTTADGYFDYFSIKLKDRGPASGTDLVFKFLINPNMVSVNRETVDAQTFARGGWQTGIWGDTTDISISGVTPGQYYANGLEDGNLEATLSYRNLMELLAVYENNGYWYEAESQGNSYLPAASTRKQIKLHADVEFTFGNFIWKGMFQHMSVNDDATKPYLKAFDLSFTVWKERFRGSSPWRDSLHNNIYRGHAYELSPLNGPKPKPNALQKAPPAYPSTVDKLNAQIAASPFNPQLQAPGVAALNSLGSGSPYSGFTLNPPVPGFSGAAPVGGH